MQILCLNRHTFWESLEFSGKETYNRSNIGCWLESHQKCVFYVCVLYSNFHSFPYDLRRPQLEWMRKEQFNIIWQFSRAKSFLLSTKKKLKPKGRHVDNYIANTILTWFNIRYNHLMITIFVLTLYHHEESNIAYDSLYHRCPTSMCQSSLLSTKELEPKGRHVDNYIADTI